jgi:phospholipid/cholesterol/gamma-HCH transport system substrate-binding protein
MTPSPFRDLMVGVFVLLGLAALAYLSVALGGLSYSSTGGLHLVAVFDEIGGLKPRAQVVVGGVKVGQVREIELDSDFRARVTLELDSRLQIPDDTSASILTSGLLGDKYVALEPGGSDTMLPSGGTITFTQSAVVLERLLGRVVQSLSSGNAP